MGSQAYVAGVGLTPMGKHEGTYAADLAVDAIAAALGDARMSVKDIDGLYTCPQGFLRPRERFVTQRLAQRLDLTPRAVLEIDAGGTTGGFSFQAAVRAIEAGQVRCALVFASEIELDDKMLVTDLAKNRHLLLEGNNQIGSYDAAYGLVGVVALYAMATQRYMHEHRILPEAIAAVSVTLREHAALHPSAFLRAPITVEDVLASRIISPPIHFLESCPWSNGAAALLVVSEEVARACGRPLVRVEAMAESHDAENFFPTRVPVGRFPSIERACKEALGAARLTIGEIDVFEVYGTFAGIELMCYEELGIFPHGSAAAAVAEGRTRVGERPGDRPVNPSGGRLSFGHPPYVTPLAELAEITTQLRGEAGPRQVEGAKVGLAQAEHGMVNGAWIGLLRRV